MSLDFLKSVDRSSVQIALDEAQSKSVVGPLLVSPIKALVSIVEGGCGSGSNGYRGPIRGTCCG